jgi:hypothetical protein
MLATIFARNHIIRIGESSSKVNVLTNSGQWSEYECAHMPLLTKSTFCLVQVEQLLISSHQPLYICFKGTLHHFIKKIGWTCQLHSILLILETAQGGFHNGQLP